MAWDVVVVGGGSAGHSAALTLGRVRRSVLVLETGEPRNAPAVGVGAHRVLGAPRRLPSSAGTPATTSTGALSTRNRPAPNGGPHPRHVHKTDGSPPSAATLARDPLSPRTGWVATVATRTEQARALFKQLDTDGNGKVDQADIDAWAKNLCTRFKLAEKAIEGFDLSDEQEAANRSYYQRQRILQIATHLWESLQNLDEDLEYGVDDDRVAKAAARKDGQITSADFEDGFGTWIFSQDAVRPFAQAVFTAADRDGNGYLLPDEWEAFTEAMGWADREDNFDNFLKAGNGSIIIRDALKLVETIYSWDEGTARGK
ncbi:FAD-binding protein [Streptomyces adustus]|uniref:FAD-binding protein n=1 Tax=Streptomyces adustus TaxID=1609272 RepID=UPI00371135C2